MLELLYTLVAPRLMLFLILMIPVYSLRGLLKMFHVHWGSWNFVNQFPSQLIRIRRHCMYFTVSRYGRPGRSVMLLGCRISNF